MSAARTGLEMKLKIRTEENRRKDHLLAAALERIPALEPPPEARESPETPSEPVPGTQAPRNRRRLMSAYRGGDECVGRIVREADAAPEIEHLHSRFHNRRGDDRRGVVKPSSPRGGLYDRGQNFRKP